MTYPRDLSYFSSIQVWRELPEGEQFGCHVLVNNEFLIVTKRELDRVQSLPTVEEIQAKLDQFYRLFPGAKR
jgi:hypothetical protein